MQKSSSPLLTRRKTLAAGAALLAAPAIVGRFGAPIAPAFAQAAATQAPGFYRYKIGDITVTAINDGFFTRPLEGFVRNAELSAVQNALKSAFLPTDKIPIPFTTLVVQTGGKLILIDTGNGDSGAPTSGTWMANFKAAGFDPAAVNTVLISHFHGDHINGLRLKSGAAVFPNAEIKVPEPEWAFWMSDDKMNAAPDGMKGAFQGVRRVFAPIAKDIAQFKPGAEVAPGITAVAAHGHTPGHCAFVIASGNARMIALCDTTNHPALFVRNPDWMAIFDQDGEMAKQSRRKMLDMAAADRLQVAFYHAPFPATGFIATNGGGYELVPVAWSSAL